MFACIRYACMHACPSSCACPYHEGIRQYHAGYIIIRADSLLYKATLTSLLCSHSHFFTKLSYSILVCCSHSNVVGRMGHQTEDIIRHCHPNRNCHYCIEGVIHIIRREYSSVLHLISGPTVVVS